MLDEVYEGEIDNFAKQGKGITKSFDESGRVVRTFEGQFDMNRSIKGILKLLDCDEEYDCGGGGLNMIFHMGLECTRPKISHTMASLKMAIDTAMQKLFSRMDLLGLARLKMANPMVKDYTNQQGTRNEYHSHFRNFKSEDNA
jgi:hypothetical protein